MEIFTVAQASKLLRTSEKKLRELIVKGELPASKIGVSYLISDKDIYSYLEKNKVTPDNKIVGGNKDALKNFKGNYGNRNKG